MKKLLFSMGLCIGLASMIVFTGCESSDDDNSTAPSGMTISPSAVTVKTPAITNILFAVSNNMGACAWTIDSAVLGSIVASGSSAIYTSTTNAGINYIHVTDSSNNTVTASVTQE